MKGFRISGKPCLYVKYFVALALAVAILEPADAAAQSGRLWRPDERILITSFHQIGAIAMDMRRIFAASPYGIEVYDHAAGRWEPPITGEDGYPTLERPSALAYDRFANELWLGTAGGSLYSYNPFMERWERYGVVGAGPVLRIVPGQGMDVGGAFVAVPGQWLRVRAGSSFIERVASSGLPDYVRKDIGTAEQRLSRMDPFFQSVRGVLTTDDELRRWEITDVAPARLPHRYWVGTDGGNIFFYDSRLMSTERYRFGLLTRGVSAIVGNGSTIWFGGDGRGFRRGVSRADDSLEEWRQYEARFDGAPAGAVFDILVLSDAVWFAAADGLYRLDLRSDDWSRITEVDGLPSGRVTALAAGAGGVWVGTELGLTFVADSGAVVSSGWLAGRQVNALALHAGILWVASEFGLWRAPVSGAGFGPDEPRVVVAGRIVDVQPLDHTVWAISRSAVWRLENGQWAGPLRLPALSRLGRLRALAAAEGRLWVAGDHGLARRDAGNSAWVVYSVGPDIPEGPVRDILVDGPYVWAATPAGALRFEWRR